MDRGHCTFATKVRNVDHIGGALAVVVDDRRENVTSVVMSDDGTGGGLRIPALLIGKKDGEILKDYIKHASADKRSQIALTASFMIAHKRNQVDM